LSAEGVRKAARAAGSPSSGARRARARHLALGASSGGR
jgi:hypothetical protein